MSFEKLCKTFTLFYKIWVGPSPGLPDLRTGYAPVVSLLCHLSFVVVGVQDYCCVQNEQIQPVSYFDSLVRGLIPFCPQDHNMPYVIGQLQ